MSGVAIIRHLLASHSPLTAEVPAARIRAGDLPLNSSLPAISVNLIDGIPRRTVDMTDSDFHSDRVQVTVHVHKQDEGYPLLQQLLGLVMDACPNQRGTLNGFACDSILPDILGPDGEGVVDYILQQSRDFIVKFTN